MSIRKYWIPFAVFVIAVSALGLYRRHLSERSLEPITIYSLTDSTDDATAKARGVSQSEHSSSDIDAQSVEDKDLKSMTITDSHKTLSHPHDLLSEDEHKALHDRENPELRLQLVETENEKARLKAGMTQDEQVDMEVREFKALLPKFREQLSNFKDLDFFLSAPSRSVVIEKYPTREAQEALRTKLIEAQSVYMNIAAEISKRPLLSKLLWNESPNFMKQIDLICNLDIPKL